MSLITRMRRQKAIYWPFTGLDNYGKRTYGPPQELDVRWEDLAKEFVTPLGETKTSMSNVYVGQLEDGTELVTGGVLWLGSLEDLGSPPDNPLKFPKAFQIQAFENTPNLRATESLRIAIL